MDLHMVLYAAHHAQLMCSDHARQCALQCRTQEHILLPLALYITEKTPSSDLRPSMTATTVQYCTYCKTGRFFFSKKWHWNFLDVLSFSNKRVRKNFRSTSTVLSQYFRKYCRSTSKVLSKYFGSFYDLPEIKLAEALIFFANRF